jgi:hypothetical protein
MRSWCRLDGDFALRRMRRAAQGAERCTMGGAWWYGASPMRADGNAWKAADHEAVDTGFRCAQENLR